MFLTRSLSSFTDMPGNDFDTIYTYLTGIVLDYELLSQFVSIENYYMFCGVPQKFTDQVLIMLYYYNY